MFSDVGEHEFLGDGGDLHLGLPAVPGRVVLLGITEATLNNPSVLTTLPRPAMACVEKKRANRPE